MEALCHVRLHTYSPPMHRRPIRTFARPSYHLHTYYAPAVPTSNLCPLFLWHSCSGNTVVTLHSCGVCAGLLSAAVRCLGHHRRSTIVQKVSIFYRDWAAGCVSPRLLTLTRRSKVNRSCRFVLTNYISCSGNLWARPWSQKALCASPLPRYRWLSEKTTDPETYL